MTIILLSIIVWWAIDQVKRLYPVLHLPVTAQKITTVVLAVAAGGFFAWSYHLDLLVALEVFDAVTVGGQILAAVAIAAGSSAVFELAQKVKNPQAAAVPSGEQGMVEGVLVTDGVEDEKVGGSD